MTISVCRVCKTQLQAIFTSVLLEKYYTQYYQCNHCGYVQTGEPFWLEEAYNIPINESDTGMIMRNYWLRNVAATIIFQESQARNGLEFFKSFSFGNLNIS